MFSVRCTDRRHWDYWLARRWRGGGNSYFLPAATKSRQIFPLPASQRLNCSTMRIVATTSLLAVLVCCLRVARIHSFAPRCAAIRRAAAWDPVHRCRLLVRMQARGPPAEPINFGKKFSLPMTNEKLVLAEMNAHPMDSRIDFDPEAHEYFVDDKAMELSVTQMVEDFFEKFDADDVIRKMMGGNRWPREGYINKDGSPFTEMEIKAKWDNIGEYARNKGTWMHYNIERFFNNLEPSPALEEMDHFMAFFTDFITGRNVQPFRTEWRIAAPDLKLAGSVDFVGRLPDGTFALLDWKRSKDLDSNLRSKYGKHAKYPLEHLDDCDGSKYFLQLNVYKFILERYYQLPVSYMAVVSFSPSLPAYFLAEVPPMADEVERMLGDIVRRRSEGHIFSAPRAKAPAAKPVAAAAPKPAGPGNENAWMDQTVESSGYGGPSQNQNQDQGPQSPREWKPPAPGSRAPQNARSGTGATQPPASYPMPSDMDIPF